MLTNPLDYRTPASEQDLARERALGRARGCTAIIFATVALAAVVVCCGVLAAGWLTWQWHERTEPTWTPPNVIASENIGDQIVTVLERHRTAAGRYPATLPELVPVELAQVVLPLEGSSEWEYRVSAAGDRFDLSFHSPTLYDTYLYNSAARRWTVIKPGNW